MSWPTDTQLYRRQKIFHRSLLGERKYREKLCVCVGGGGDKMLTGVLVTQLSGIAGFLTNFVVCGKCCFMSVVWFMTYCSLKSVMWCMANCCFMSVVWLCIPLTVTVPCLSREPNSKNWRDHLPCFKTLPEYSKDV
jgi:hypothetical protein